VKHFSELRSKYEEMRALRLLEVSVRASGTPHDPKPRLSALAEKFPGALREIDMLTMEEIEARIDALARAEREPSSAARWMHAMDRFHALTRGALFIKRELARRVSAGKCAPNFFDAAPADAHAWRDDVDRIASPPRGRLMDLVYERLARELATTPRDAKKLVFTSSR
jgi:hypothetical protein